MANTDILIPLEGINFFDAYQDKFIDVNIEAENIEDTYVNVTVEDFLNSCEESYTTFSKKEIKRLVAFLMDDDDMRDCLVDEVTKAAASISDGSIKAIFRAAQLSWKEADNGW